MPPSFQAIIGIIGACVILGLLGGKNTNKSLRKKEFSGKYTELMRIKEIISAGNGYNSVVGYSAV
jgi:hypothetical protein